MQIMISKIGKIALFSRVYRSWITNPKTGQKGHDQYFPKPNVLFHPWVYDYCTKKISVKFF